MAEPDYRYLPPLLSEVRDRVGIGGVKKLIAEFGGKEIVVPRRAKQGQLIAERCGLDVEEALVSLRGGEKVAIPRAAAVMSAKAAILAADTDGLTTNEIAGRFAVTSRYVRRLIGGRKAPHKRPGKASVPAGRDAR
jgi:hypothetical protein